MTAAFQSLKSGQYEVLETGERNIYTKLRTKRFEMKYSPLSSRRQQMIALLKPVRMQCISAKKFGNKEFGTRNDDAGSLRNK